jgi:hypothetical protein
MNINENTDLIGFIVWLICSCNLGMKTILTTFKKNLEIILNASESKYSNGPIEGINRMIKQIQRTAFGFRNYHHLGKHLIINRFSIQIARSQNFIEIGRFIFLCYASCFFELLA